MVAADVDLIVKQLDDLVSEVQALVVASHGERYVPDQHDPRRFSTRLKAAIDRFSPPGSTYRQEAASIEGYPGYVARELIGVATALRDDYKAGAMQTVTELVHAAVFEDFLEMATELHDKTYSAPAAVVAGSTLEEHIRKLADKNGIDLLNDTGKTKSFEDLTVALVKKEAFSEPRRKILAGWYGQRTAAAHGHYDKVIPEEVGRMIVGIREFIDGHPA